MNYRVPLIAHNSSRFDQILINRTLGSEEFQKQKIIDTSSIKLIPKSLEVFLTQSFNFCCSLCDKREEKGGKKNFFGCAHYPSLKTIDSLNHLQSSLDNLTNELKSSAKTSQELNTLFSPLSKWIRTKWVGKTESEYDEILEKLTKKQSFCYSYIKNEEVLEEEKLPPIEEWQDSYLDNKKPTTEAEVKEANEMFNFAGCKKIGDFYDFYLRIDVELLCCVFESWRKLGKDNFSLDPVHYVTNPGHEHILRSSTSTPFYRHSDRPTNIYKTKSRF